MARVAAANMAAIQKVQRQPMLVEQKPLMMGANRGPKTVATMKMANARPRVRGSPYTSARMPATTAIGALPNAPQKNRKTRNAGQLGAKPHASVKMPKRIKVPMLRSFRPKCSLMGP